MDNIDRQAAFREAMAKDKERREQTQAARARLAEIVETTGGNMRARGRIKEEKALNWVYRWGWSTPGIIDLWCGAANRNTSTNLVKKGLLKTTETGWDGTKNRPKKILTLTDLGLSFAVEKATNLVKYKGSFSSINLLHLRHYFYAQLMTLNAVSNGEIIDFQTEAEFNEKSEKNEKRPDVLWHLPSGEVTGVEVELTEKHGHDLLKFVDDSTMQLYMDEAQTGHAPLFTRLIIASTSQGILKRYQAAFAPGLETRQPVKNEAGRWVSRPSGWKIPRDIGGKISYQLLD
ncbi:hypothetical protein [Trinickia sp.]|uniref:hypothetical protein n=1 Tax=Trinickia sp. TaxID=2571163 RepID=UPI003F80439A